MWILESRGDCFQGRRMWLRPGKQYLFGRVKKDGVRFALDNKTVSRKHFVICVDDIQEADVGNIHARTRITIADQGSKTGTLVNGEKAKDPRPLTLLENVIRVGTSQEELMIRWEPKILTFNLLKKEIKSGLLKLKQERVRDLDIKAISDYIPGTSTLLIVNKRNTAKGLQALIDGKSLVAESYIDALEYAATPTDLDEEENLCPLELDFDKAWPNPTEHLPPPGKEPTLRPSAAYQSNLARRNIFEHFTFVFGDQTQYDNLLPPITTGHGKALMFKVVEKETTAEDLVTFMRQTAGEKSFGDAHRDTDQGAVIMVRWTGKTDQEWTNTLINNVALQLDQRAIEQGEFLDAILASDALLLRQAVPYESNANGRIAPPSTAITSDLSNRVNATQDSHSNDTPISRPEEVAAFSNTGTASSNLDQDNTSTAKRRYLSSDDDDPPNSKAKPFRFSPVLKTEPKQFDDDFDENAIVPFEEDDEEEEDEASKDIVLEQKGNTLRSVSEVSSGSDEGDEMVTRNGSNPSRKRSRATMQANGIDPSRDDLDDLLPAATNMKRRKMALYGSKEQQSEVKAKLKSGVILPKPSSRTMKEVDVKEELRVKREMENEKAKQGLDKDDERPIEYDEDGNLPVFDIITDYIDLERPKKNSTSFNGAGSEEWDPKWNGRKNFKAFRRARDSVNGDPLARRRAHTRVIVPLIDAKQTTYGIGEQYWDKTEEDREKDRRRKKQASQRTTQSQPSSSIPNIASRSQRSHNGDESASEIGEDEVVEVEAEEVSPTVARLQQEAAEILDNEIDPNEPRMTRSENTQQPSGGSTRSQSQTQKTTSTKTSMRGSKRPASSGRGAELKKQKTLPIQTIHSSGSESDDSDDMKFKFGRGRRGRGRGRGRGRA